MIGGCDIIIEGRLPKAQALRTAATVVSRHWPSAVAEDGDSDVVFNNVADIPFDDTNELMLYKTRMAKKSWDELGADRSNINTMIHLIWRRQDLTIVVDDPESREIKSIVTEIKKSLRLKKRAALESPAVQPRRQTNRIS